MPKRGSGARLTTDLKGINFPARRNDLIQHAKKNNAPQDTIEAIESMPDREYMNMADVMQGYGQAS